MATLNVTGTWQPLPYQSGTVANNSVYSCEVSKDKTDGLVIYPGSRFGFDDVQLYIKSMGHDMPVRVVNFQESEYTANMEQVAEEVVEADQANTANRNDIDDMFS